MDNSLIQLFDQLVSLATWLDNECENTSDDFTSQLRKRIDKIKELKSKVQIDSHGNN